MKRDWNVVKGQYDLQPGDEVAVSRATALANLADAPTIESLIEALAMLDRIGGQLYVQARREKYDAAGQRIPEEFRKDTPGQYETVGYVFRYETRDAELEVAQPPDEVALPELPEIEPAQIEDLEEERAAAEDRAEEPVTTG